MTTGRKRCTPAWVVAGENPSPGTNQQRTVLAGAVLPFDEATPVVLTPPAVADGFTLIAEISVERGHVRFTTTGEPPNNATFYGHRQFDGSRIELESTSEVNGFRLIGLPGQSGTLYVEFFSVPLGDFLMHRS